MIQKRTDQTARGARFIPGLHRRLSFFLIFLGAAIISMERPLWALTVTPTVQQFDLKPGEKKKGTYTVTNDDAWDMTVIPQSKDWFVLPENQKNGITAPDWLIVKGATFTLKPGASHEVPFEVRVPKASTGELVGMVSFAMEGGSDRFVKKILSVAVYVGINGTTRAEGKIMAVMVDPSSSTLIGGFFLYNAGNVHLRPTGLIQIYDSKDLNVANITIQRSSPAYPGERKAYTGEIPHYTLAPGDYSAKISVTDSDRNIVIPETTKKFTVLKDKKVKAK
jgi:hypothetical protein